MDIAEGHGCLLGCLEAGNLARLSTVLDRPKQRITRRIACDEEFSVGTDRNCVRERRRSSLGRDRLRLTVGYVLDRRTQQLAGCAGDEKNTHPLLKESP